ncbi:sugar transferase [Sinimarinibacterium thermocellulolyticum]|uniref:Sugar transferase n=1 Tax=Sinimarinibacterium thermocellulolyticum TaxID=3170016 RepID=A0ABV2A5H7_9GAMM
MLKRAFDCSCAALGLVALAPVFAVIAILIRADSPGPVFYRQVRVGRHGELFRIWKFRTMTHVQPDGAPQITAANDARITRIGRVLRRFKLDELPQLINVLVGEMSLVGPRPEVPRYVALYPTHLKEIVLSVRPGITDLASLSFRHESEILARSKDPEREYVEVVLPQKLALSAQYIATHSLRSDLVLIIRTLARVFRRA